MRSKILVVPLLFAIIVPCLAGCFARNNSQIQITPATSPAISTTDSAISTTDGEIMSGHLEISSQGKTYVPIEHWVYSLENGVCADGKWFDKLALEMDPDLKANLKAAEAIPYSDDITFLQVWSGGARKADKITFAVFDAQMEPITAEGGAFEIPAQAGQYTVAALLTWGNEKENAGYQYIFKVVRSTQSTPAGFETGSQTNGETWNPATAKAALKGLPLNYKPEQAVEDGCLVILHGKLLSNPRITGDFAAAARAGKAASLRIVQYTVEGDAIIMQVDYLDSSFHVLFDESRDHFGRFGAEIVEYHMPYLAIFDDKERQVAYLVKEDGLSFEAIQTIEQNQSAEAADAAENLVFLYQYGKG